ncbi:hypothetical protein TorRG33x02_295090 [Trema orientale]|uniref:Uncharacterized protein n=1 Tax=Trema orientale TaxID=63057 RepID=A0A2P5C741_TREOI|nr:hypothetical protein TorRG33x02_295090 [Trema orientale]
MLHCLMICPYHEHFIVKIADGSLSKVAGTGTVVISKNLVLKFVLLAPKLICNSLSVSKITRDLRCIANFSPTCYSFQDLASRKMIGNAKECAGLYLLQTVDNPRKQTQTTRGVSFPVFPASNNGKCYHVVAL